MQFLLSKVRVKLRPTVNRPVRLGVRHPSETSDQIVLLLEIFFRQLRVCYFVALSLTRGRIWNLLLLLVLASAVPLGSENHGTQDHLSLSPFLRLTEPGGPGLRIYIPQEQGGPNIPTGRGMPYSFVPRINFVTDSKENTILLLFKRHVPTGPYK
jgi:hypothetical protein